ncbi:hypothetical protein D0Z08_17550 [Nocardioides immobilis]|uniref:Peptidase M23 domain-containing protein n=1 Tax=Nocardioides immobilis TaxID=2049295 RepID=A0A417XZR0_9ACTN|nr:peptidoglycan DD-metalloendopeptidase family protein [Nocardioides immobilis]RHW25841.1 hypothetical protein D0Z08_17550 [Nocardioides immobilis]
MSRKGPLAAGALVIGVGILFVPAVLMVMVLIGGRSGPTTTGCGTTAAAPDEVESVEGLRPEQLATAATIVSVGAQMGVPRQGVLIALATAHQESGLRIYANDGRGDDLKPDQQGIERSLQLPHEAVGTDHGSLGVFQQQWPWWGSMRELMDPATSARKFYERLLQVPNWQDMPVTDAAQAVQRSAYPDAYADDEVLAEDLLDGFGVQDAMWTGASYDTGCIQLAGSPGSVVAPIGNPSAFTDLHNFGAQGGRWSRGHTGTDFSAACGTPVRAAHGGTVIVKTDEAWSGRWLVQVSTGPGRLTTWYAHMQSLNVVDGQPVRAGDQLGEVGDLGNSTGCHLHFEVHPRGGSIYEDSIDPSAWLRTHAGDQVEPPVSSHTTSYVVASFNVLGHSHTAPGGNKPGYAPSHQRIRGAIALLEAYDVDVVGLQEFQHPQRRALLARAGDRYAVYSPPDGPANSIAWRRDRWALVSADVLTVPYFNGKPTQMPIVRLRNLVTGQDASFLNVHNPASTRWHPGNERFRDQAARRELATANAIIEHYELPVFLMGDFNEREEAFCTLTAQGTLAASAGGSHAGGCNPPRNPGIDWIFGSTRTTWVGHLAVRRGVHGSISDHPFVVARAIDVSAASGGPTR